MSKLYQIAKLRAIALDAGLELPDDFRGTSDLDLALAYNGIGSESTPAAVREALTAALNIFEPAALIHDYQYSRLQSAGLFIDEAREAADAMFYRNCRKLACYYSCGWADPIRYLHLYQAWGCWRAVRRFGGIGMERAVLLAGLTAAILSASSITERLA